MKRPLIFACGFLLAMLLFWYGGVDFHQRGFVPAWSVLTSLFIGYLAATNPFMEG